jgi:hypothetical protein
MAAHDSKVEGTAAGGVLGALAGAAISGGRASGAIIGGVAGAAIGNNASRIHCPPGYGEVADPDYVPPPPVAEGAPPPAYDNGSFWREAPRSLEARIDWMQQRIEHSRDAGALDPRQIGYAQHDLNDIRRLDTDLRARDGGQLSEADRGYLQSRLDSLGQNLRWMRSDSGS